MNESPNHHASFGRFGCDLARDPDGRLYDRSVREMLGADRPDLGPIETLAAVRTAARGLHLLAERWAEANGGLSEGRLQLMFRLYKSPGRRRSLGDLADSLGVTPRNVTGLVDNLERGGLVERVPDPADRRSIFARLTPAGEARVEQIGREMFARQADVAEGMSPEDLAQLRHLCFRLVERMTGMPAPKEGVR